MQIMSQGKKKKNHGSGNASHSSATPSRKPINWMGIVALILMLGAIFSYVATLDEGDPEALPNAESGLAP